MALVTYSDSDDSDNEQQTVLPKDINSNATAPVSTKPSFTIDKAQPNKIKVNLQQNLRHSDEDNDENKRAAKRLRTGAGTFSGFNSLLPAPKRDGQVTTQNGGAKPVARKVFSLKTSAEAAFSRESDQELRTLFAEQSNTFEVEHKTDLAMSAARPMPAFAKPAPPASGPNPFHFKPLSVARNQKKKKAPSAVPKTIPPPSDASTSTSMTTPVLEPPKQKVSLFSAGPTSEPALPEPEDDPDIDDSHYLAEETPQYLTNDAPQHHHQPQPNEPQSLTSIATDLNLSEAERRQLFGRNGRSSTTQALNIVNFNTDAEYAANRQLIANGETVQHNPVRGIAPGKHSLKQLLSAASGQKEALEESFAQGRRNKREAGNKYGW